MSEKQSGRRTNLHLSRDGAYYSGVKKWLKKHITRRVRRKLNRCQKDY